MSVAFVTTFDSSDMSAWSGSMFSMLSALRRTGLDIHTIDKLSDPYSVIFQGKRLLKNVLFNRNYLRDREPLTLHGYARQVERRLSRIKPNIIFSAGTLPIAFLQTNIPIVFWADATFSGMIDYYPEFTNLCAETIRNGTMMEQAALSNCRLAIYSSEWAAKSAIVNYDVDSKKVKVVPYGANLTCLPVASDVRQAILSRGSGACKLLFVGVDWYRKGGEKALLVASRLNERAFATELHVVGCDPPSPLPAFVKTYGYLSKSNYEQNKILSQLYKISDFFILPSKAECAAVVVAEANAFGLPALSTKVGGMETVVRDERNGRTFDVRFFVEECTDYILQTMAKKDQYHNLCTSSLEEYSTRLNWDSAVKTVLSLIASEGLSL
jgi:glycosyltransferase involved in cell wall biosynthesis